MALVNSAFTVNVTPGAMPPVVHVSEYDVGRTYTVTINGENGSAFNIPTGTTATVEGTLNGAIGFTTGATISGSNVSFTLTESMTARSGKAWCKIKLTLNNEPIQTCAFVLAVDRAGAEADTVIGADGFDTQIQNAVDNYLDEHPVGVEVDPTLTIAGAAADAKVVGDGISDLKSDLNALSDVVGDTTIYEASLPESPSGVGANWNLYYNKSFPIGTKVKLCLNSYSGDLFTIVSFRTYDSNDNYTLYSPGIVEIGKVQEYTIYKECVRIWIQINRSAAENGVNATLMLSADDDGLSKDVAYLSSCMPVNTQEVLRSVIVKNQDKRFKSDGTEEDATNWVLSDYIPVGIGLTVKGYSYSSTRPAIVEYNANKLIIGVVATDSDGKYITKEYSYPNNVAFVRIQSILNIGKDTYAISKIYSAPKVFYVEKDGSGDFTKLTDAINEAIRYMDSTVYVGAGTWDLIDELDIGTTYIPSSSNRGLVLKNRIKVIFSTNSKVTCNYTGSDSDTITWLSAFNSGQYGFTLENATIESSKCRYSVHDERDHDADEYNNYYINCRMKHDNTDGGFNQCIGGGLGLNGHVIIDGCTFENPARTNYQIVYYHNSAGSGKNFVEVKGCYFKGSNTLGFQWYGQSPSNQKSILFAHGNSLGSAIQHTGAAGATIENTEVISFNNEIRSS